MEGGLGALPPVDLTHTMVCHVVTIMGAMDRIRVSKSWKMAPLVNDRFHATTLSFSPLNQKPHEASQAA